MPASAPILDVIRQRSSCRSFQPQRLEAHDQSRLEAFLANLQPPPFPGAWRFRVITPALKSDGRAEKIGTYGTITGARQYIAGAIRKDERALLNYGFLLEQIILEATAMGLGTCWLGGAFHRSDFSGPLERSADELLPAVTPVGYPMQNRSVQDQVLRMSAGSKSRKPFPHLFFEKSFQNPIAGEPTAGAYGPVLEAVRLGPSASNRQPWRIVKAEGNRFHFYLQRNVLYGIAARVLMNTDDIQLIDMGIAMCHFELAARALNLKGEWLREDPGIQMPDATHYIATWR